MYKDHAAGDVVHFEYLPGKFIGFKAPKDLEAGDKIWIDVPKEELKPKKPGGDVGKGHTGHYYLDKDYKAGQRVEILTSSGKSVGFDAKQDMAKGTSVWIDVDHKDQRASLPDNDETDVEAYVEPDVEDMGAVEHMDMAAALNVFTWL